METIRLSIEAKILMAVHAEIQQVLADFRIDIRLYPRWQRDWLEIGNWDHLMDYPPLPEYARRRMTKLVYSLWHRVCRAAWDAGYRACRFKLHPFWYSHLLLK